MELENEANLERVTKGVLGDVYQRATNTVGGAMEYTGSTVGSGMGAGRSHAVDAIDFTNVVLGRESSL